MASRPPLDEPEFARWRPGGPPGSHYGPTDSNEAIADAEIVLAYVDETRESIGG